MTKINRVNPIVRFAVDRRITMTMVVFGIVVLGYVSLLRIPLEFLPSFSSNSMWVSAPYDSSSPEEIERLIVRPLEDILGTINGIDTLNSTASAREGSVSITFKDKVDMDLAIVEVRDRIDRVRSKFTVHAGWIMDVEHGITTTATLHAGVDSRQEPAVPGRRPCRWLLAAGHEHEEGRQVVVLRSKSP